MKYKTLFYDVEPISNRLPDDCLKIIIQYLKNKQEFTKKYSNISKFIHKYRANRFIGHCKHLFGKECVHHCTNAFGEVEHEYYMYYCFNSMILTINTPRESITYDCNTFRILERYQYEYFVCDCHIEENI